MTAVSISVTHVHRILMVELNGATRPYTNADIIMVSKINVTQKLTRRG